MHRARNAGRPRRIGHLLRQGREEARMEIQNSAIDQARQVVIERLAAFKDDPTDERLEEVQAAIDDWMSAAGKARN